MNYRFLVTQPDLNAHGTLHGGILMKWVDEACGMEARIITGGVCATRHIGDINFCDTARLGDIIEVSVGYKNTGKTSLTFSANAFVLVTSDVAKRKIASFDRVVFVAVDKNHKPRDHRDESSSFKPVHPDRRS